MADVQTYFLDPINDYLQKPAFKGPAASRLQGLADNLNEEALRAAAEKVIKNMTGQPRLQALEKALRNTDVVMNAPMRAGPDPWDIPGQIREHHMRRREAAIRCKCNLGRRADKEGWLPAMLDFAEDHGRIPEGNEINACIGKSRLSEDALARAKGIPFFEALVVLRLNMLERASMDVFGDEAIKRTPDKTLMSGSQGRRAGSSHVEKLKAEARLAEIEQDYAPLSLSPMAQATKAGGYQTRSKKWSTEDVDKSE